MKIGFLLLLQLLMVASQSTITDDVSDRGLLKLKQEIDTLSSRQLQILEQLQFIIKRLGKPSGILLQ